MSFFKRYSTCTLVYMNGINTLQSRSHNNDLIERAFVERILQEEGENIARAQDRVLNEQLSSTRIDFVRFSRTFEVSDMTLRHTHHIQQRFIDMKRTRYGKQKPIKVHNSIIYGHWNNIVFRTKVELTEALRRQIAVQLNLEV